MIMHTFQFFKKIVLIVLPVFMLAGFGCNNSDDDLPSNSNISQTLTSAGGWKVSYYFDKDKDETNDFSGFIFRFNADGSLESTRNGATTTGTWAITSNDGTQRLVISSGSGAKPLSDLDDDWIITEKSDNQIKLKDDNDDHLEELHFEKL